MDFSHRSRGLWTSIFYSLLCSLVIAAGGCTTELDTEGLRFACDSDADCTAGYACLEGEQGRLICQDPDDYQAPDAGPGDTDTDNGDADDAGDTDAGDTDTGDTDTDTGPDVEPECQVDDQEACDCQDLPGEIEGQRQCSDDGTWGECVCPETCADDDGKLVVDGTDCGICGAGVYECNENGDASCSDPGVTNDCGGCADHPPALSCGSQELLCMPDESTTCVDVETTEITVEAPKVFGDVHFGIFSVDDVDQACEKGWEIGAVDLPVAYRRADVVDEVTETSKVIEIEVPTDLPDDAVVRLVIEQEIEILGQIGTESVPTRFGCAPLETSETSPTVDSYLHPRLLRGIYEMTIYDHLAMGQSPVNDYDSFWDNISVDWVFPLMYTYMSQPAALFVGCEGADCPRGDVDSLLEQYDAVRSQSGVPTLSFWSDFYGDFGTAIDDLGGPEPLVAAYQELFDDHLSEVFTNISGYEGLRSVAFDDDANMETLPYLLPVARVVVDAGVDSPASGLGELSTLRTEFSSEQPITGGCLATGGGPPPKCFGPMDYIETESDTSSLPNIEIDDDMESAQVTPRRVEVPRQAFLEYLVYDYLPSELYPALNEEEVGPDELEYSRANWESLSQMFRTIAPCDEVVARLESQGVDGDAAQAYGVVCDDLYGDPDGLTVLSRLQELVPLASQMTAELSATGTENCQPYFTHDPYHGIRLAQINGGTTGCQAGFAQIGYTGNGAFIEMLEMISLRVFTGLP